MTKRVEGQRGREREREREREDEAGRSAFKVLVEEMSAVVFIALALTLDLMSPLMKR